MFAQAARAEVLQLFKREAECTASVQKMYRSVMESFHSNKSHQLFHNAHEPVTCVFNILMDNNLQVAYILFTKPLNLSKPDLC